MIHSLLNLVLWRKYLIMLMLKLHEDKSTTLKIALNGLHGVFYLEEY